METGESQNEPHLDKMLARRHTIADCIDTDTELQIDLEKLADQQEENLIPLKEDLAEWLARVLGIEITADNFMDVLDNGVYVCKLAELIQNKAVEWRNAGKTEEELPVKKKLRYLKNAKSESWFARDNTANFLEWCRTVGVTDECLFESDGLVMHKNTRNVLICLLELARIGMKFGIEPPNLIKLEKEIEKEEKKLSSGEPAKENRVPSAKTPKRPTSSKSPRLDDEVKKQAALCRCEDKYRLNKLSEGRYDIGGKIVFIRILSRKHLMVRVGGGWETLQSYLQRHDPCRMVHVERQGGNFLKAVGAKLKRN